MICPRCGHMNESNASQCDSCYASLDPDTAVISLENEGSSRYEVSTLDKTNNPFAAFGMLLGIGSTVTCCTSPVSGFYIPGILGFIALMISLAGKSQIEKSTESQEGKGLAMVGMILGGTGLLGSITALIMWFLGIGLIDYIMELLK